MLGRRALAIVASFVLGCGTISVTPSAVPDASPTPCVNRLSCVAPSVPIRTLPPIPSATPDPRATPVQTATAGQSTRIAIGSCLRYPTGGAALGHILQHDPDLMLWLGDNIYADTEDMSVMRSLYETLGANPRFQALRAATETMAVWDDHDMGWDNANSTWPFRDAAKEEFLRFWGAESDDPRWEQPGVYSARTFGSGDRTVQVILLDVRYNLDPWDYAGTDPARRILGDAQSAWLRERLSEPARIRLIGSGIQVVQDYDFSTAWEGWGDSPLERERLFALIRELRVPGVVFVSGDMHFAELSRHPDDAVALGYPTYDLTPSGLDQVELEAEGEWLNPNRIGELLNTHQKHGLIEIDWAFPDPEIHLQIWDLARLHLSHVVRLSDLQPT